jgi:hypothetical protein
VNLPIRVRLTAWYAALLALIIVALGTFLVLQLRTDLRETIDTEVLAAVDLMSRTFDDEDDGQDDFREVASTILPHSGAAAQIQQGGGRVQASYGGVAQRGPLASDDDRAAAMRGESCTRRGSATTTTA